MNQKSIHTRGLTSFFTLFGFLVMSITGLILYIVPEGRIAYWVDWRFLGLTKSDWGNIHILSSILFIIAGIFHTWFNWKPLLNYFRDRLTRGLKLRKELGITLAVTVVVVASALFHIPPLGYFLDLNEFIKEKWIVSERYEPPFGHAEQLSLEAFAIKMNIDLEGAAAELRQNGIDFESPEEALEDIARNNGISPMDLYMIIEKFETPMGRDSSRTYTPTMVEVEFGGTGLGNKTLTKICRDMEISLTEAERRLTASGLKMETDETLKSAADRYDLTPIDILKIILVEDFRIQR